MAFYNKNYPLKNRELIPRQPVTVAIGSTCIELRCEVWKPAKEVADRQPVILVFYMKNALSQDSQPVTIDTFYLVNIGDLKITELGALIDNHWRIPLRGARGTKSSMFVASMKNPIVESARQNGVKDLTKFIGDALQGCGTELFRMNMSKTGFRTGGTSRLEVALKEFVANKSAVSFGGKLNKVISAGEAVEQVSAGDEFIFAVAELDPVNDTIEFSDNLRKIYGNKDENAFAHLFEQQAAYVAENESVDQKTFDKRFNKLYNTASGLLKYKLINKAIDTAGDVGKAAAGDFT